MMWTASAVARPGYIVVCFLAHSKKRSPPSPLEGLRRAKVEPEGFEPSSR